MSVPYMGCTCEKAESAVACEPARTETEEFESEAIVACGTGRLARSNSIHAEFFLSRSPGVCLQAKSACKQREGCSHKLFRPY